MKTKIQWTLPIAVATGIFSFAACERAEEATDTTEPAGEEMAVSTKAETVNLQVSGMT